MTETELRDSLRLIRSAHVGPITYHRLLARFHSAAAALDALPELTRRGGAATPVRVCSVADAERELERCTAAGVKILGHSDKAFPPRLKHIEDSPPLLFVRGHACLLAKKAVAVIGARNASSNGRRFAEKMAADLGSNGLLVVSGLARGIDASAHLGSLDTGTVAVLGGGVDIVYPRENSQIYAQIAERGVLVSEMPVGTVPKAAHFPRRNRIISGISRGIVVVEAAPRSGSLITARLALEQGRDVFAVPGSALDPRARGTNDLIRQGAILTESATDVLQVLEPGPRLRTCASTALAPPPGPAGPATDEKQTSEIRQWLESRLGPSPVEVDDLAREFMAPASVLSEALMELELAGRLERHPGNLISAIVQI